MVRPSGLILALVLLAPLLTGRAKADDGFKQTGVQGDCWIAGTPMQCASGWWIGSYFYYRVTTYWGGGSLQSRAAPGLSSASSVWTNAAGPQLFVGYGDTRTPYMNVYALEYPTYQPSDAAFKKALQDGAVAVAKNWKYVNGSYQQCYNPVNGDNACLVAFSEVYVSANVDAQCSGGIQQSTWQYVYAHEFGHTQGLDDHFSGNILMNSNWSQNYPCYQNTTAYGPTSTDLGTPVPSGASSCGAPRGIRCIFKWPN